ncbi:hypothetical protein BH09SUM1_BH09SUM1_03440 [soil metagenome]
MNDHTDQELWKRALQLHRGGSVQEARGIYARLLSADPENAEVQNALGAAACQLGEYEEAIRLLAPLVERDAQLGAAHNNLAEAYRQSGRHSDARQHYERAIGAEPERAEYYNNYGELLRILGEFEAAAQMYEKAISLNADYAAAYANLALCRKKGGPEEIARFAALLERPLSSAGKSQIHFALGGFHDAAGDYASAFDHFEIANQLKGAQFNGRAYAAYVQMLIDTFDADFFAAREGYGLAGEELPVFIVGMPRSGTSLVEQVLASHPSVHGAGELTLLGKTSQAIATRWDGYPRGVEKMSREDVRSVAENVVAQLRALAPSALRITDKMPMNFFHVGLIRLLFPQARIIHCVRHPLDIALSCYTTDFSSSLPFSYDLRNIGIYYLGCRRLMKHFSALPGAMILNVPYEELAGSLETGARRVIEFCGLSWNDKCLLFHESDRPVSTASSWQVRQPVYTSSIGRWRRYEAHMRPLREMLEYEMGERLE